MAGGLSDRWRKAEQQFLGWLAGTATGSMVKVAIGALLAYAVDHVGDLNAPTWLQAVILVVVPVGINVLNPADGRYGVGKFEFDPDAVDASDG